MKNKRQLVWLLCLALGVTCACTGAPETDFCAFVNPKIGSGGHGHVFVGASVPFGMVQLGPTGVPQDWDWCSGYHDSDSSVIGFSHTHLSGTGIGDLFDVTVMPVTGQVTYSRGTLDNMESGLWSYAGRTCEIAEPGYYSVPLVRYGIMAELTAAERTGFHRYTFPESAESAIVIDLENGGCWDKTTQSGFEIPDSSSASGWRYSTGWAKDQKVYFHVRFSKPFTSFETVENGRYARFNFSTGVEESILVKVSLSPCGIIEAEQSMDREIPDWDFDAVRALARAKWNRELGKIKIETRSPEVRSIFYTALYHTMISPSLFCDEGTSAYTVYSLWDTYRAAMPLLSIIHPDRRADIINSMLDIYDSQGKLPVWHLAGNETDCMVGNPGAVVVADAIVKQLPGIDFQRAYSACKASVMLDERDQDIRKRYGFIPCDLADMAIAKDMEYAIADAAVSHAAASLGLDGDAAYFEDRSHSWKNYFDEESGFVRGRFADGKWRDPFNPFFAKIDQNDYCEGNAWQYTWLTPHDLPLLEECFGGRENLLSHLDSLFAAPSILGPEAPPDISGLIGQYVHGNEPSHHIPYFYAMCGQRGKTAEMIRQILHSQYSDAPDGISGNEDAGQMSAWYVLSALGFYQVEPASSRFWFGSPILDGAKIRVDDTRTFDIRVYGNSDSARYIDRVCLNGKDYVFPYLDYSDITAGGKLEIWMKAQE